MTEVGDKLVALAGIASEFAAHLGPTYLAGMWERGLVGQFLWFTGASVPEGEESARRPDVYTGPVGAGPP